MTGPEQLTAWLFGTLCVASAACSIARSITAARVEVAHEHARAYVRAQQMLWEAQFGTVIVPPEWQEEGL